MNEEIKRTPAEIMEQIIKMIEEDCYKNFKSDLKEQLERYLRYHQ